jgi:hypothetical protein
MALRLLPRDKGKQYGNSGTDQKIQPDILPVHCFTEILFNLHTSSPTV